MQLGIRLYAAPISDRSNTSKVIYYLNDADQPIFELTEKPNKQKILSIFHQV